MYLLDIKIKINIQNKSCNIIYYYHILIELVKVEEQYISKKKIYKTLDWF